MRKRVMTFKALRAQFLNLHIRNPHIKSYNLAKTESLLFLYRKDWLQATCVYFFAHNCDCKGVAVQLIVALGGAKF